MTGDAGALAHELPYWGWVDERTCLTRAGELITVGALTPVVTDGRTADDLDTVVGRWQRMLSGLPPEMRVSWIVERRPAAFDLWEPGADIAGLAQRKRQAFLTGRVQDLDAWVVWSFDPRLRRSAAGHRRGWWRAYLAEWLRRRRAPHESVYLAADLARAVKTAAALVAASAARVVDVTPIETLTAGKAAAMLYRLVNGGLGAWVPGMRTDAGVNWRLAGEDVAAERQALHVGGSRFGVWSCVAPPATVTANVLEELYALPAPMTVVVEWRPWSREAARRKLRSAQRHYFSKRYSMAAHMQEKEGTAAALEDAAASIEARRAGEALVELETEGVSYGDVALSVAVRGSAEQLEQWGADIQRVFGGLDAKAARESYGQLAVWFGRLPGQPAARQPRRVFVSAGVAACVAPLFGPPQGERRCAHLNAPALTVFETPAGTPYHYDLFGGRDVGHTLMLGATGAGKSFTLNFLLVQALQYDPRVLILDLGGSYRALTQFLGGGYLEVSPEKDAIPLRPFSLEPTERTVQFLSAWVLRLLRIGGWEESSGDLSEVRARIQDLYALAPARRSLGNLVRSLPAPMWPALSRWHGSGAWGKWFDNPPVEDADLTLADWQVIDLAGAVEHEDWCEAALLYLLERLRTEIESPAEATRLKLMVVDEAWRYLRDPVVLGRLTEAARTWRKRNAALILATQSVTDITETAGAAALLESMPTRLFLANPDFPEAGQATFQLSDDELRTVRELEPKRELYLRRPTTAAVLRLAVDPESYWLYTSSAGEAQRRAEMVARYGVEGAIVRLAAGLDHKTGGSARLMRGGTMTRKLIGLACCGVLAAAPAGAQGIRTVAGGAGEAAIAVTARVRHTTTVVLPREETVVDVVAGDADYWDVSAAGNVAYVKPLEAGAASNVTLVAESGRVWALLVAESSGEDPDLVVYVEGPARPAPADAPRHAPAFVAGGELAAHRAGEAAARVELQAIDEAAAAEVAKVWADHDIGIGGSLAAPPLPHHRAYGSVHGGSTELSGMACGQPPGVRVRHAPCGLRSLGLRRSGLHPSPPAPRPAPTGCSAAWSA